MSKMPELTIRNFAQIAEVCVKIGDLTVVVGPQATGKSLALQWLKLAIDGNRVLHMLTHYGFDWGGDPSKLAGLFFGEGMESAWSPRTEVTYGRAQIDLAALARGNRSSQPHRLFYVPAHRALTISGGWPAAFRSSPPDTPFVVRAFGERVAETLATSRGFGEATLFPVPRRLPADVRDLLDQAIFHGAKVKLHTLGQRRELQIVHGKSNLSYMAWTAGQREFVPLLLGLYDVLPLGKIPDAMRLEWVVIEEPEMGLHPKGILAVVLLVFALLSRGYKVVLSTHSPLVLNVLWAVGLVRNRRGAPTRVLEMFDLPMNPNTLPLADAALKARFSVTYFDFGRDGRVRSKDISGLDPASMDDAESGWGGLTLFNSRIADRVAAAIGDD
jgi:hypothetical protein